MISPYVGFMLRRCTLDVHNPLIFRGLQVRALFYGLAVNAYSIAYVPAGSTEDSIFATWDAASDAQVR